MLDKLFMLILDMTKVAAVIIAVVFLIRLLLKKAPKKYSYILWAVVLFRLLCPVTIESAVSLVPQMEPISDNYTLEEDSISVLDASVAAYRAVGDALNGGLGIQHIHTSNEDENGDVYVTSLWWEVWVLFGQYVWVAGIGVLLIYSAISYFNLRRKLVGAVLLRDNIYVADHITSPFVIGLWHPVIYLPSSLSEKELEYIILHEQHHIRRFDHIAKVLSFVALCIHWFNPLVWLAFVLSGKDMEMSCDEAVVKKLGTDIRADYSASLLSLATGRHIIAGMPLAFGEGNTKGRIKNLAKWKKPTIWISVAAAVVIAAVLIVCGTNTSKYSWYRVEMQGNGINLEVNLEEPINSWALYVDIYEDGQLFYSEPRVMDTFKEYNGLSERKMSTQLRVQRNYIGETLTCTYVAPAGKFTWNLRLPKQSYTSSGMTVGDGIFTNLYRKQVLPEGGEIILCSSIFSTEENGSVYGYSKEKGIVGANDTVVQFRLVVSEKEGISHFKGEQETKPAVYGGLTSYKSTRCLYMNPLSSFAAIDGDSGYRYTFGEGQVFFINKSNGNKTVFELGEWEDFPWSDEAWNAMFWPDLWSEDLKFIIAERDEIRYCPLSEKYFLLYVDGTNWIVEMYDINKVGWRVWSIFEIVPE